MEHSNRGNSCCGIKLKHWRGVSGILCRNAAPVLEFLLNRSDAQLLAAVADNDLNKTWQINSTQQSVTSNKYLRCLAIVKTGPRL